MSRRESGLLLLVLFLSGAAALLAYQVFTLTRRVEALEERVSTHRTWLEVLNEEINILVDMICSDGCGCGQTNATELDLRLLTGG